MKTTGHTQLKTFLRYVNLTAESVSESAKSFGKFLTNKIADARYKQKNITDIVSMRQNDYHNLQ